MTKANPEKRAIKLAGRCILRVLRVLRFALVFRRFGVGFVFFASGFCEFGRLRNREASRLQTRKLSRATIVRESPDSVYASLSAYSYYARFVFSASEYKLCDTMCLKTAVLNHWASASAWGTVSGQIPEAHWEEEAVCYPAYKYEDVIGGQKATSL